MIHTSSRPTERSENTFPSEFDQLEKLNYVVRVNDSIDRRKKHIVITELGTETLNKCEQILNHLSEKNTENISEEEMDTFKKVLIKLKENAER